MKIGYLAGESFDKSFLIAEENGKRRVVRASLIMPVSVQKLELTKPEVVCTPDDCMAEISASVKNLAEFDSWVKKEVASLKRNASMRRVAIGVTEGQQPPTFARNEGEVVKPEGVKSGVHAEAGVDWATNPTETNAGRRTDLTRSEGGGKISTFFNRLPKTVSEVPEDARNLQSSLVKENTDLKARLNVMTKKAKEADVQEVMQRISTVIEPAERQKWLDRLVNASESELALINDVLDKTEKRKAEASVDVSMDHEQVPQIFASEQPSATEGLTSTWLQLDEMKAEREHPQI